MPTRPAGAHIQRLARDPLSHAAVLEKYGATGVTAFDCAVEVIPLICPAHLGGRLLNFVQSGYAQASAILLRKAKIFARALPIAGADDHDATVAVDSPKCQPITMTT